jgi:hypothetical protein
MGAVQPGALAPGPDVTNKLYDVYMGGGGGFEHPDATALTFLGRSINNTCNRLFIFLSPPSRPLKHASERLGIERPYFLNV